MALSREEREQLRLRAAGLREEVQAVRAEADLALVEKAQEQNDDKLIAEVERLEQQVEDARAMRDSIVVGNGSVEDAIKAMEAASKPEAPAEETVVESVSIVPVEEPEQPVAVEQPVTEEKPAANLSDPFAEGGSN